MKAPSTFSIVIGVALLVTLSACNERPVAQTAMTSDAQPHKLATASHGETVFRLQNLVMDNLITAQMSDPPLLAADRASLASFEIRLVDACRSLNEAAGTRGTGGAPGMVLQVRAMLSMAECERSAVAAKTFMATDHPLLGAALR